MDYIIIKGEFTGTNQYGTIQFEHPTSGTVITVCGQFSYDDNYYYHHFETENGNKYLVQAD